MKNKKVILFGLFNLNPFISLLFGVLFCDLKTKSYIIFVPLSFAFFAYMMVPYVDMDITRYYELYNSLLNTDFNEVADLYSNNLFIIYSIKLISILGLNKEFIPFFNVFISYIYYLKSFSFHATEDKSQLDSFKLNLFVLCSISFIASASGLRNGLATAIAIYGVTLFTRSKYFCGVLYIVISCVIHSYIIPLIAILLITIQIYKFRINPKLVLITSAFIGYTSISSSIVQFGLSLIPSELALYVADNFIENKFMGQGVELSQTVYIVQYVFNYSPFYICLLYLITSRRRDKLFILSCLLASFALILIDFKVLHGRYQYLAVIVCACCIIQDMKNRRYIFNMALAAGLLNTAWMIFRFRYIFMDSIYYFYIPTAMQFINTIDINNLRSL